MVSWTDAPECGVHVRIARTEPVAECRPDQLARSCRRRACHDDVRAGEEVGGGRRIGVDRAQPREGCEHGARPLPAVADEIVDAPGAATGGMRAGWLRIPPVEAEHAVLG